ncbi:MAG: hypothetical protein DRQ88_08465, partial [Epsilonproteobacteria bacterium]
ALLLQRSSIIYLFSSLLLKAYIPYKITHKKNIIYLITLKKNFYTELALYEVKLFNYRHSYFCLW